MREKDLGLFLFFFFEESNHRRVSNVVTRLSN